MPLTTYHSRRRLLRRGLLLGSVALLAMGVLAPSTHAQVWICHVEDATSFPPTVRRINVPRTGPLYTLHLSHGDWLAEPEVCDGVDNDCDGVIDNHLANLGTCTVGQGVCAMTAPVRCQEGVQVCTAVAGTPLEPTEVTLNDGLDNDCDGLTDTAECPGGRSCPPGGGGPAGGGPAGGGQCSEEGKMICHNGLQFFDTCNHGTWVSRKCAPGTKCKPNGSSIICA